MIVSCCMALRKAKVRLAHLPRSTWLIRQLNTDDHVESVGKQNALSVHVQLVRMGRCRTTQSLAHSAPIHLGAQEAVAWLVALAEGVPPVTSSAYGRGANRSGIFKWENDASRAQKALRPGSLSS